MVYVYDADGEPVDYGDGDLGMILGSCTGVRFVKRGANDSHVIIQLMIEDDENWFVKDFTISSYWLDDLIQTLQRAKINLEAKAVKDPTGGWRLHGERRETA